MSFTSGHCYNFQKESGSIFPQRALGSWWIYSLSRWFFWLLFWGFLLFFFLPNPYLAALLLWDLGNTASRGSGGSGCVLF